MGQNFRLVAPRAKISLPWGGKLGEMLFDGSAKVLVQLLAVPVRPKILLSVSEAAPIPPAQSRSDRCATRMDINDSVQEIPVDRHAKRKVNGEVLACPSRHHKRTKTKGSDDGTETDHSITLSGLPKEVHQLIFIYIEFIEDIICIGLTSRYFWAIGREHMHDYYTSFRGQWAGENIVCVGEDVEPNDFPPRLFSVEELDELRHKTIDIPYDDDYPDEVAYPAVPFTLYHLTFPGMSDMEEDIDLRTESLRIYFHCRERGRYKDPVFQLTRSEMVVKESTYFPQDQPWILRNLTTKEFVCSEAIALKPEFIHGPNIEVLGFGEIVMSRICWSTSSSVSMSDTTNISKGVWAGHCFDITTLARHDDETKGVGWSDVSNEVTSEIASLWESEYGTDWRETVCKLWGERPGIHVFTSRHGTTILVAATSTVTYARQSSTDLKDERLDDLSTAKNNSFVPETPAAQQPQNALSLIQRQLTRIA
ncbi:hypothetical protein EDB81DRAFT_952980 [Dactylonectria macrodidyma]|uniref:F-box domain-containing protein n=1 Tax=Dactylonectria macrodidyma TaxID=307937 RepID=A0A9P9ICD7_9HYPO|nr:hypothetical protein EDB81DRAFT_952980 [Dactylonectria macrodidyma]